MIQMCAAALIRNSNVHIRERLPAPWISYHFDAPAASIWAQLSRVTRDEMVRD